MAAKTTVHNLHTLSGKLPRATYIGRGSIWGNPFVIGRDGDRKTVIAKYRRHLWADKGLMAVLPDLRGRQLLCFCSPEPCHGDVLVAALAWHDREARHESAKLRCAAAQQAA